MVVYVALKKTNVIDDTVKLPRPKLTQEVLLKGSKEECMALIEELSARPENQSTDIIEVAISCIRFVGQKTYTSETITKNNGSRDTRG